MSPPTAGEARGRVIRFTCSEHGEIWSAAVYCEHDVDSEMRDVGSAHRKPYGAGCTAVVEVEVLDAETMQREWMVETWVSVPERSEG